MKKLLLCVVSACLLTACATLKEAQNLANCKFALKSVELVNYNLTSFDFDVVIAITNLNKKEAASLKRFEGVLTVNEDPMANVTLKDIHPMKFMRDPFATSLDTSGYCCTFDKYHKSVFEENPKYKEQFEWYQRKTKQADIALDTPQLPGEKTPNKDYYTLITYWVKEKKKMYEIHVINNDTILHWKEIKPAEFPIAELYCEVPGSKLVGVSPCAKIFANNSAYNIMQSLALTAEFRNQRPPKFVSNQAGLNIRSFAQYGDDPDKTFIVNLF